MVHFVRDDNISTATLSKSRAHLCEILATRIFRENAQKGMLQLATVLTTAWPVYNGADPFIVAQAREERDDDLEERVGNAIEMAILGKAKKFIRASACQKVVESIWSYVHQSQPPAVSLTRVSGKCVYQAESSHSILSDVGQACLGSISLLTIHDRPTNAHPFIFTIPTKLLFLTTTGKPGLSECAYILKKIKAQGPLDSFCP